FALHKFVSRAGLILIAATSSDAIARDLRPDVHVVLPGEAARASGHSHILENVEMLPRLATTGRPSLSILENACIERGTVGEYRQLAPLHYRHSEIPAFIDRIFVLRERPAGDVLGVVVYGHAPLELALRNQATGGRFRRNPGRLRRELRILRRLIV